MSAIGDYLAMQTSRQLLADEWEASGSPTEPDKIAEFYRHSQHNAVDLHNWHDTTWRKQITEAITHAALATQAKSAVDIGCGNGDDCKALLYEAGVPDVVGVEPNEIQREQLDKDGVRCVADVADAPIEEADLIVCIDVLEHIYDPETWLTKIAERARVGAYLIETCATFDTGTPLHLKSNRGWRPGRVLERAGWLTVEAREDLRLRVWQRTEEHGMERSGLLVAAYRGLSAQTLSAVIILTQGVTPWRVTIKHGDGLINRARSQAVSRWWADTGDDVFLMLDDDIDFSPHAADRLVETCREKRSVVCAAYPIRNGAHLACHLFPGQEVTFGPDAEPVEIEWAATGFMAVHRDVIDALIPTLRLLHANEDRNYWDMFCPFEVERDDGIWWGLSEDWAFAERARLAGFPSWLDPTVYISHLAEVPTSPANMKLVHKSIQIDKQADA